MLVGLTLKILFKHVMSHMIYITLIKERHNVGSTKFQLIDYAYFIFLSDYMSNNVARMFYFLTIYLYVVFYKNIIFKLQLRKRLLISHQ